MPSRVLQVLLVFSLLWSASCGKEKSGGDEPACFQNSDCKEGLLCALGRCRLPCTESSDCGGGASCITDGVQAVCQSLEEKDTPCNFQEDCPRPLGCASDYRCRNLCLEDDDCNIFGITGRRCAEDMHGTHYCAEPHEVSNGLLISTPPKGATGPYEPWSEDALAGDAGGQRDAGKDAAATAGDGDGDGDGDGKHTGPGDRDASVGDGDGGPDAPVTKICKPGCVQNETCVDGECVACGSVAEVCCDGVSCAANLTCAESGMCECGGANQACCGGSSCEAGLSCDASDVANPVCACGLVGTRCCPGEAGEAPSCEADAVCAGSKCSCVAELSQGYFFSGDPPREVLVRRVDGTVWQHGADTGSTFKQVLSNGVPLKASSVSVAATPNLSSKQVGCALLEGGTVSCFPSAALTDSSWLGAGLGAAETTSTPVQVVTGVGGAPLTGVKQLAGRAFASTYNNTTPRGPTFCAVTEDGAVWCWGYGASGELGRGDTSNSTFARKVMSDAATPFADAVEVQVGWYVSCARKQDGSVWCWGTNKYGELGVVPANLATSYYPVQVNFTGTAEQTKATRLTVATTGCVLMQDGSVVCGG